MKPTAMGPMIAAVFTAVLFGCVSQTTVESKLPDQPAASDANFRARIHTERAAEYFKVGNYAVAIDAVQQALAALPGHAPAYNMLGIIQMTLREDDKAAMAFEQATRLAPNDSEILNNYGWFICQRRNARDSLPYFQAALRNPLYVSPERALHNAGVCARKAGDLREAEVNFRAAVQKAPLYAAALVDLADILYGQGRIKDSEALFARYTLLTQAPTIEALILGVRIYRASGDRSAESSYIQQLRRRFPEDPRTREVLEAR
ncbi:MAG TPA: type IV pilus biogenesis/stability protein PilW [Usitatibacteraceae bacterium]|nr:type IV pilus biogenesis/stability protein PilW [Usitatibacteraceae bacterium]